MSVDAICIIPARGGSKRIPNKNIRSFFGRPLITYAIETALKCECFSNVIVSTDSPEIADIASGAGAVVPSLRSSINSTDTASTTDVMKESLDSFAPASDASDSIVCCLYPAAVLISKDHLQQAIHVMRSDVDPDSVMAVQEFRHPPERVLRMQNGCIEFSDMVNRHKRTQELEQAYHDAGQFYFFRSEVLRKTGTMLGVKCVAMILEPWEAVDLDTESDWKFLERIFASSRVED